MTRALFTATLLTATVGFALPCAPPFAALAAFAAGASRRAGTAAIVAAWAVNQTVGFGVFGYPRTAESVALGAGLLLAALVASECARRLPRHGRVAAFVVATAAYEAVLLATDLAARASLAPFAAEVVALVVATNAAFFAAFAFARRAETRAA